MELGTSREAISCAVTQEFLKILWNPMVHHRGHRSPPLVPILSHINSVDTTSSYISKIHFNIIHAHLAFSPKYCMRSSYLPYVLHVLPISSSLT
jgi:hypothetical protein